MHLLLPPSESKTVGGRGRPLRARPDGGPLADARGEAIRALLELVAPGATLRAAAALLLPPAVTAQALADNAAVLDSPTTPALRRYSGVVYDGLDHASLTPDEQRLAGRRVLIFSGLFGVVRGAEPVPAYRVPAKANLPGLGIVATYWRPILRTILPSMVGRDLVVDLRSGDYAAMWRPSGSVVRVRVLSPVRTGHAIISFTSKLAKGRLAAALIRRETAGERVATADDVVAAWAECGGVGARVTADGVDLYTGD